MFWLVDIFKFVFSLAIVGIHSWFLGDFRDWLYPIIYYSAVPYFFIASGFFFAKKYYAGGVDLKAVYNKFCKRLFTKLVVFEPISQLQVILLLVLASTAASTILVETVQHIIFYPFGGMWYIQALIVAGLVLLPFIKKRCERYIIPVGILFYLFALICGRYYFAIEDIVIIKDSIDKYLLYCISPKNGLFIGFIYMGLGVIAAKNWNQERKKFRFKRINLLLLISSILFFTELYLIKDYYGLEDGQFYLMQPFFVFALFLFSAKYYETPSVSPKHNTLILRNLSISIYLLHAPVQRCFTLFQEITGIHTKLLGNPYSLFILTLVFTLLICYPIYKRKTKHLYDWLV